MNADENDPAKKEIDRFMLEEKEEEEKRDNIMKRPNFGRIRSIVICEKKSKCVLQTSDQLVIYLFLFSKFLFLFFHVFKDE